MQSEYTSTKNAFSITPPAGWSVDESGRKGTDVIFKCATTETSSSGKPFVANITVSHVVFDAALINKAEDKVTVLSKMVSSMGSDLTAYTKISEEQMKVDGCPATLVEQTFTTASGLVKNMQLLICYDNAAFIISGTMLCEFWEKYAATMRKSLFSFRADITKNFRMTVSKQ